MKNIFKLMGLALIAGSMMFVACNKDENDDNNTNNNQEPASVITVQFGDNTWTPAQVEGEIYADEDYLDIALYADTNDVTKPMCSGELGLTVMTYDDTVCSFGYAMNQSDFVSYGQYTYYGWVTNTAYDGSQNVTAIDLNKKTISATGTYQLMSFEDYLAYYQGQMAASDVRTAMLNLTFENAKWE
ncbi:MAG: hypothetical protein J6V98_03770 [Bacteroidales bacterium]|nr:hypothetical protein [Bacteroidales bacterium]